MALNFDPQVHHRRSVRFKGYDYSQTGGYFITLIAHQRECFFGEVSGEQVKLNLFGQCIAAILKFLPLHFNLVVDEWILMPDHLHAILILHEDEVSVCSGMVSTSSCKGFAPTVTRPPEWYILRIVVRDHPKF